MRTYPVAQRSINGERLFGNFKVDPTSPVIGAESADDVAKGADAGEEIEKTIEDAKKVALGRGRGFVEGAHEALGARVERVGERGDG
jgi:flagellin-like hook-associated protein FlgL